MILMDNEVSAFQLTEGRPPQPPFPGTCFRLGVRPLRPENFILTDHVYAEFWPSKTLGEPPQTNTETFTP